MSKFRSFYSEWKKKNLYKEDDVQFETILKRNEIKIENTNSSYEYTLNTPFSNVKSIRISAYSFTPNLFINNENNWFLLDGITGTIPTGNYTSVSDIIDSLNKSFEQMSKKDNKHELKLEKNRAIFTSYSMITDSSSIYHSNQMYLTNPLQPSSLYELASENLLWIPTSSIDTERIEYDFKTGITWSEQILPILSPGFNSDKFRITVSEFIHPNNIWKTVENRDGFIRQNDRDISQTIYKGNSTWEYVNRYEFLPPYEDPGSYAYDIWDSDYQIINGKRYLAIAYDMDYYRNRILGTTAYIDEYWSPQVFGGVQGLPNGRINRYIRFGISNTEYYVGAISDLDPHQYYYYTNTAISSINLISTDHMFLQTCSITRNALIMGKNNYIDIGIFDVGTTTFITSARIYDVGISYPHYSAFYHPGTTEFISFLATGTTSCRYSEYQISSPHSITLLSQMEFNLPINLPYSQLVPFNQSLTTIRHLGTTQVLIRIREVAIHLTHNQVDGVFGGITNGIYYGNGVLFHDGKDKRSLILPSIPSIDSYLEPNPIVRPILLRHKLPTTLELNSNLSSILQYRGVHETAHYITDGTIILDPVFYRKSEIGKCNVYFRGTSSSSVSHIGITILSNNPHYKIPRYLFPFTYRGEGEITTCGQMARIISPLSISSGSFVFSLYFPNHGLKTGEMVKLKADYSITNKIGGVDLYFLENRFHVITRIDESTLYFPITSAATSNVPFYSTFSTFNGITDTSLFHIFSITSVHTDLWYGSIPLFHSSGIPFSQREYPRVEYKMNGGLVQNAIPYTLSGITSAIISTPSDDVFIQIHNLNINVFRMENNSFPNDVLAQVIRNVSDSSVLINPPHVYSSPLPHLNRLDISFVNERGQTVSPGNHSISLQIDELITRPIHTSINSQNNFIDNRGYTFYI